MKKAYIVLILLFTLYTTGNACWWEDLEEFCEIYGIEYNEYDTYEDFMANASDNAVEDFFELITFSHDKDGNIVGVIATVDIIATKPTTNTSVDPEPIWETEPNPVLEPEPEPKDCAGVEGGTAYLDNCNECVGGTTEKKACIKDCTGVYGGTAIKNSCEECVGGSTGIEGCEPCIPLTFYYGMSVTPINSNPKYSGYSWCSFLTLATIKGGDPCTYAEYYYSTYLANLNISGCESTLGPPEYVIKELYAHFGVSLGSGCWDKCSLTSGMNPNKGLIVTPGGHILLVYGLQRSSGGNLTMSKYDTQDDFGWNRSGISLDESIYSNSNAFISN